MVLLTNQHSYLCGSSVFRCLGKKESLVCYIRDFLYIINKRVYGKKGD